MKWEHLSNKFMEGPPGPLTHLPPLKNYEGGGTCKVHDLFSSILKY